LRRERLFVVTKLSFLSLQRVVDPLFLAGAPGVWSPPWALRLWPDTECRILSPTG
jgi:hypothetical protein